MKLEGAVFFDGVSPRGREVVLVADPRRRALEIHPTGGEPGQAPVEVPWDHLKADPPLGSGAWALRLPGGAVCECPPEHYDALAQCLKPSLGSRFSRRAERSLWIGLGCFILSLLLVAAFFQYGIPWLALRAARSIPPEIEALVTREAMRTLDRVFFQPSALPEERQESIRQGFAALTAVRGDVPEHRIEFRQSRIGPNAFALPAGLIIMTDELVRFAENDGQIHGVLAHELGHIHHRHGMRAALQAAGHALVITVFLGDVSSVLSAAAALPSVLIETGHSRKFEREADAYAAQFALETGLGIQPLMELLQSLTREYGDGSSLMWLSTHPPTRERILLMREWEKSIAEESDPARGSRGP